MTKYFWFLYKERHIVQVGDKSDDDCYHDDKKINWIIVKHRAPYNMFVWDLPVLSFQSVWTSLIEWGLNSTPPIVATPVSSDFPKRTNESGTKSDCIVQMCAFAEMSTIQVVDFVSEFMFLFMASLSLVVKKIGHIHDASPKDMTLWYLVVKF